MTFIITILLAYLSYEFFEKRFLSLKGKYSAVRNSGTAYEDEIKGSRERS
jgi:peptidoglycan/LPS O-acetylase OafA/YrhL